MTGLVVRAVSGVTSMVIAIGFWAYDLWRRS
jgi:hypothetical protein